VSRTDLLAILGFVLLVAAVTALVFGNPFALEGAKLQEFVGYIVALLLSAVVLLVVANQAILRSFPTPRPTAPHDPDGVRVHDHSHPAR